MKNQLPQVLEHGGSNISNDAVLRHGLSHQRHGIGQPLLDENERPQMVRAPVYDPHNMRSVEFQNAERSLGDNVHRGSTKATNLRGS